jgi:Holliday junction DNA helicase RuvA
MIAGVRGTLMAKHGDLVTIATPGGVTYEMAVPLGVLERLPPPGGEIQLHTALVVREDGWALFGFDRQAERTVFQRLLAASGVGPRLALALLSALGGERVVRALKEGDLGALCAVPGVGRKKAERMVLELRDRLGDLEGEEGPAKPGPKAEQAVSALANLGFGTAEAESAVRRVLSSNGAAETAELIRGALHILTTAK